MKTRSVVVLTLSLVAVAASPALAADKLLQPSITPFTPAPKPMVEVEGVAYYGSLKVPPPYIGNSPGVFMFFKWMDRNFYEVRTRQRALKEEQDFYIESVKDLGGIVIPRLNATTQAQLDAIGPAAAIKEIQAYSNTHALVQEALLGEQKAWAGLDAAMKEVDADSLVIVEKDLMKEQADKRAQKEAIIQKAKDNAKKAGLLGKVVGMVKTGVTNPAGIKGQLLAEAYDLAVGTATNLVEEALINNVLIENMETMRAIDARLTAIDTALTSVSAGIHKNRLAGKRKRLDEARLAVMEAGIRRTLAQVEAIDKIDALAAMERNARQRGSKLNVFDAVQSYFEEMRMSERRIRQAANNYLEVLEQGAPGQTPRLVKGIRKDINDVRTRPDAGTEATMRWLRLASSTGEYMGAQEDWYRRERQRVQDVLVSLETGRHLDFVQSSMATLFRRAGSTR